MRFIRHHKELVRHIPLIKPSDKIYRMTHPHIPVIIAVDEQYRGLPGIQVGIRRGLPGHLPGFLIIWSHFKTFRQLIPAFKIVNTVHIHAHFKQF